jgi:hypothetical protein
MVQISSRARRIEVEVSTIPMRDLSREVRLSASTFQSLPIRIVRARSEDQHRATIARSSAGLAALGEQLGGKPLRFRDALNFDRDGIDRLLQLFKLQILRATPLELSWLPLNAANETDCDSGQ